MIYLAGLTLNLSHLIFLDAAYHSEWILSTYGCVLENFRGKNKVDTSSKSMRSTGTIKKYLTSDKVIEEFSARKQIFVLALVLLFPPPELDDFGTKHQLNSDLSLYGIVK